MKKKKPSVINKACLNKPWGGGGATTGNKCRKHSVGPGRGGVRGLPAAGRCRGTRGWDQGVWSGSSGWAPPDLAALEHLQPPTAAERKRADDGLLPLLSSCFTFRVTNTFKLPTKRLKRRCRHVPQQELEAACQGQ